MKIREIIQGIHRFAPLNYQESYDNSGLQVGDIEAEARSALLALDVTEAVVEEAVSMGCNLIIAHHPVLFKPLKRLSGANSTERIIIKAIQNNIAIFAAHTNLDNMQKGVNLKIAQRLGIQNPKVLAPVSQNILKLHTYIPEAHAADLANYLFAAGAGAIGNYDECSFRQPGTGTFRPGPDTDPMIGKPAGPREYVQEQKLEVILPEERRDDVLRTLFRYHPYEEVAYGLVRLENTDQTKGAGMIGELPEPVAIQDFLALVQESMAARSVRYTQPHQNEVQRIAFCGGSGSFLLPAAIRQNADVFLSADFKYHQFFDAENQIIIADIGHYESEQFTVEIFSEILKEKFPNFATHLTNINTNPINYYI
ncbi:MAG TPA: Nif3-like dinuclear metal center hexameric protein [Edaphocola sp.]|nr:Nif3-like dinuclear metal center hexameric protein [Edaphocola sp.]